jgi:DNA-binding transcriptional regulator YiaG
VTPDQLKEARRKLGLSASGLARALRLGIHGGRTVRRWEAGDFPILGPAQVAIEYMLAVDAHMEKCGEEET